MFTSTCSKFTLHLDLILCFLMDLGVSGFLSGTPMLILCSKVNDCLFGKTVKTGFKCFSFNLMPKLCFKVNGYAWLFCLKCKNLWCTVCILTFIISLSFMRLFIYSVGSGNLNTMETANISIGLFIIPFETVYLYRLINF